MPFAELSDGCRIHYVIDDYTDPWKEAPWLVMNHGFGRNLDVWYGWVPTLARDFRILRLDMRGHGQSTVPQPGYAWSGPGLAEDVRELMDSLGIDRASFLGESLGTAVGECFAHAYPNRIEGLVLCCAVYTLAHEGYWSLANRWRKDFAVKGVRQVWLEDMAVRFDPGDVEPGLIEWYADLVSRTPVHVLVELLNYQDDVNLDPLLPEIKAPTLILAGSRSPYGPADHLSHMAARIPDCRLQVFQGRPHAVNLAIPESCAEATRQFLHDVRTRLG